LTTCPVCGTDGWDLDPTHDEYVCRTCGLVRPAFTTTAPVAPGPTPGPARRDARLEAIARRARQEPGSDVRWRAARHEAHRLATALGCPPDVADRAAALLRAAQRKALTQGRDLDALAAASLVTACRMLYLGRSVADVAAHSPVAEDRIQGAQKVLVQGLGLSVPSMTAHEYLASVNAKVGAPPHVEAAARRLLDRVCGTRHASGKSPLGWAAAALVLAGREADVPLSANAVARAVGISTSTVTARLRDLSALAAGG
jgi:transcription initiation factor TFIIB